MRVTPMRIQRARSEERGAVLVIVTVSLFAMLALTVLVFDLGHVVEVKRDMVNASDAAALAAAQKCASLQGTSAAQTAAQQLVVENRSDATLSSFGAPDCDAAPAGTLRFVTVGSQSTVGYFFAQLLGFTSGTVTTTATAAYGPTIAALGPAPLRLDLAALTPCMQQTPGPGSANSNCAFGFDNTNANSDASSQWGLLNFPEGWPTDGTAGPTACSSNAGGSNELRDYILGQGTPFTALIPNPPQYVYVCAEPGQNTSVLTTAMPQMLNKMLTFPVMSDSVPRKDLGGGKTAYPIMGFTDLRLVGFWWGQQARQHCPSLADAGPGHNASLFCIQTEWDGSQLIPGIPGDGQPTGTRSIRLVK